MKSLETKISPKLCPLCPPPLTTFHEPNTCGDAAPRFQFLITVSWEICTSARFDLHVYSAVRRWLDNRRSPNSFHIRMRTNTYLTNPFIFGYFTYLGMALKSTLVDNLEVGHRPRPLLASVTLSLHLGNPQTSSLRCVFLRRLLVSLSFML